MPLTKLTFDASVYKDDSPLAAEGHYIDSNKARPRNGRFETIGGWESASNTTLSGIARKAIAYSDQALNKFAAFGTHHRLYVMDKDGAVSDITPVTSRGELTNAFGTSSGSAAVSVTHTAHGLVSDQAVTFPGGTSVNGATISGGPYAVSVTGANTYLFSASTAATATSALTGGTVDYQYHLAPGQADGLGGLGYGTGGYGVGGYGSPSTGLVYYPRTWSLDVWGQNVLACPRGGAIYEFAPNTSATELITNGDFSVGTGWSAGSGWSIGGGRAQGSAASGSLARSATLSRGAWHLLDFDASVTSGTLYPFAGSTSVGAGITTTATYKRTFFASGGATDIRFTGSSFVGTVDNVSVKVLTVAEAIPNAPSVCTGMFVTAERIVVAYGVNDTSGNFDAMLVKWSDQENNNTWTASAANFAGSFRLAKGSRIVGAMTVNGDNLIWTDDAVYLMRYTGEPSSVYRFDQVGNIGLLGPDCACLLGGVAYWVSPQVALYGYSGGVPVQIASNVIRDVRENFAKVQQDKAYLRADKAANEIWLHYPDGRDGSEVSRYLLHNIGTGKEAVGTFDRTCWIDAGVYQNQIAVSDDGAIFFHEKGTTDNGAARSTSLTTAFFDLGDGDSHMNIVGIMPDHDDLEGGYSITLKTRHTDVRGRYERTYGPFNVTNTTRRIPCRAVGQEAQVVFSSNDSPSWWRMGAFKLDVKPSGRRR